MSAEMDLRRRAARIRIVDSIIRMRGQLADFKALGGDLSMHVEFLSDSPPELKRIDKLLDSALPRLPPCEAPPEGGGAMKRDLCSQCELPLPMELTFLRKELAQYRKLLGLLASLARGGWVEDEELGEAVCVQIADYEHRASLRLKRHRKAVGR